MQRVLRHDAYREEYQQEFGGVGIRLRLLGDPPMPTVIGLPEPGSPAAEADSRVFPRDRAQPRSDLSAVPGKSVKSRAYFPH